MANPVTHDGKDSQDVIEVGDEITARLTVIATVGFVGRMPISHVKEAVKVVERRVRQELEGIGSDVTVSVSVNFNV